MENNNNNSIHIYDIYGNQIDDGKSGWKVEIINETQSVSYNKEKQDGDTNGSK